MADARADFRVRAGVPIDFAFACGNATIFDRGFDLVITRLDGQEFFLAGKRITDRLFVIKGAPLPAAPTQVQLGAITAAKIWDAHANTVHRYAEGGGQPVRT